MIGAEPCLVPPCRRRPKDPELQHPWPRISLTLDAPTGRRATPSTQYCRGFAKDPNYTTSSCRPVQPLAAVVVPTWSLRRRGARESKRCGLTFSEVKWDDFPTVSRIGTMFERLPTANRMGHEGRCPGRRLADTSRQYVIEAVVSLFSGRIVDKSEERSVLSSGDGMEDQLSTFGGILIVVAEFKRTIAFQRQCRATLFEDDIWSRSTAVTLRSAFTGLLSNLDYETNGEAKPQGRWSITLLCKNLNAPHDLDTDKSRSTPSPTSQLYFCYQVPDDGTTED
ncbi:hypothetical protein C8J57DRAFT_1641929 [Mycena rebaudengoi]|nr:hypothetical protein C8J57DRAFT_1641929 [Mycena rebaudengoi]